MNIFDGYEDKTPEELANELGISGNSNLDTSNASASSFKTKKKIIKNMTTTLPTPNNITDTICPFSRLRTSEIENDYFWSSEITYWEKGSRIKHLWLGKIKEVHKDYITIFYNNWEEKTIELHNGNLPRNVRVFIEDEETENTSTTIDYHVEEYWVRNFWIEELQRNTRIQTRKDKKIWRILDINDKTISIRINNQDIDCEFNEFQEQYELYKDDFDRMVYKILSCEGIWTDNYKIQDLHRGMYVQNERNIFVIKNIVKDNIYLYNFPYTSDYIPYDEFVSWHWFKLFVADKKHSKKYEIWTSNFTISDLNIGTNFIDKSGNAWIIKSISYEEKTIKAILGGIEYNNQSYSFQKFKTNCKIEKRGKIQSFIWLSNTDIFGPNWTSDYDMENLWVWIGIRRSGWLTDLLGPNCVSSHNIEDLWIWVGVRILNADTKIAGKIIAVDLSRDSITTIMENGIKNVWNIEEFRYKNYIFKKDITPFKPVNLKKIQDKSLWSDIDRPHAQLQRWARIIDKSGSKCGSYNIIDIEYGYVTIIYIDSTIRIITIDELIENFKVYTSDIRECNC